MTAFPFIYIVLTCFSCLSPSSLSVRLHPQGGRHPLLRPLQVFRADGPLWSRHRPSRPDGLHRSQLALHPSPARQEVRAPVQGRRRTRIPLHSVSPDVFARLGLRSTRFACPYLPAPTSLPFRSCVMFPTRFTSLIYAPRGVAETNLVYIFSDPLVFLLHSSPFALRMPYLSLTHFLLRH